MNSSPEEELIWAETFDPLAHELELARAIQQSFLPKTFPALAGFGMAGFCQSAGPVGGDFYDVVPLDADSALLVMADVMGQGVPAALFAATLRTLVRSLLEHTRRPAELLTRLNRLMFEGLSGADMFITVQLALANPRQRCLTVASAGHCPLWLIHHPGQPVTISPEGIPLGILPETAFAEQTVLLMASACALLHTDGLTEVRNPAGEFFGQARLENWLRLNAGQSQTAAQLKQAFLAELERFQNGAPCKDDLTFLLLVEETAHSAGLPPEEPPISERVLKV